MSTKKGKGTAVKSADCSKCIREKHTAMKITLVIEALVCLCAAIIPMIFDVSIGAAIIRDINVLFISINATLIGLYVTAFIFLNDSLKARVKDDPTLGEAVSTILYRYRTYMIWFSFFTIASIVLEVVSNISLGGNGVSDLENWHIHTADFRWFFFIFASAIALAIMTFIIYCSKQITDSDGLIAAYSMLNLKKHEKEILKDFRRIRRDAQAVFKSEKDSKALDLFNPEKIEHYEDKCTDEGYLVNILAQQKKPREGKSFDLVETLMNESEGGKKYSRLVPYLRALHDTYEKRGINIMCDEYYEADGDLETEIVFGKRARFIETIITKISQNNIDKSIMKDNFLFDSMRSGFQWVYAKRKNTTNVASESKQATTTSVDIRDEKRFLDYVKYKLITAPVFKLRPFNNKAVERLFEKAAADFKTPPYYSEGEKIKLGSDGLARAHSEHYDKKVTHISNYKSEMYDIIDEFFRGYENVIGYRDALIHYRKYSESGESGDISADVCTCKDSGQDTAEAKTDATLTDSRGKAKKKVKESVAKKERRVVHEHIVEINLYAELLIRVMIDRFTSFVKVNSLNLGNSTFDKGWFNYSELSGSSFTHSSFYFARIENAILKGCDLSTCNFINADASDTNFSRCNFSYSNLTGMDLHGALLDNSQMNRTILRDPLMDRYYGLVDLLFDDGKDKDKKAYMDWLGENPGDNFKGAGFTGEAASIIQLLNGELTVPEDDVSVTLSDALPESVVNQIDWRIKQFVKSHDAYKLPKKYFDELVKRRNLETEKAKKEREEKCGRMFFGVANLSSASGAKVQFKSIDFSHVDMRDAAFTDSDLSDAEMYYTKASNLMLERTNLNDLDAYRSDFKNANFSSAMLINGLFLDCNLDETTFERALLHNATFASSLGAAEEDTIEIINEATADKKAKPDDVKLEERLAGVKPVDKLYLKRLTERAQGSKKGVIDLIEIPTNLLKVKGATGETKREVNVNDIYAADSANGTSALTNATFNNVLANNVRFLNINAMRSSFSGSMMKDCLIYNSLMRWCGFRESKLANAILVGTSFSHTAFSGTNLSRAKIYGCEFTNAGFVGATLISTSISKTLFSDASFENASFSASDISNCAFFNCSFENTNIANTVFKNCIFYDFDFKRAIGLESVKFENCVFSMKNFSAPNGDFLSLDLEDMTTRKGKAVVYKTGSSGGLLRYSSNLSH